MTYTPLYYLLSHFSRFIRPGARRIGLEGKSVEGLTFTAAKNADGSIAVVVFNRSEMARELAITLHANTYGVTIAPRAMQTIYLRRK